MNRILGNLVDKTHGARLTHYAERVELMEGYFTIAMIYARREAAKGFCRSAVYCPAEVSDLMEEKLKECGFRVSDFGYNFDGYKIHNRFIIDWANHLEGD